jgi:ABC-type sugar transport system permease subunit
LREINFVEKYLSHDFNFTPVSPGNTLDNSLTATDDLYCVIAAVGRRDLCEVCDVLQLHPWFQQFVNELLWTCIVVVFEVLVLGLWLVSIYFTEFKGVSNPFESFASFL